MKGPDIKSSIFNIENKLNEMAQILSEGLKIFRLQGQIGRNGPDADRSEQFEDNGRQDSNMPAISQKIINDPELRYLHIKIIQYLSGQYDFKMAQFQEVHFSKIVKECRIGKNRAAEYLGFLIEKGLLCARSDGYRRFYQIKQYDI